MLVIFDLDQTLIDSESIAHLRKLRRWHEVYPKISTLEVYPGITELLADLKRNAVQLAIVTTSPRPYCERIIKYNGWPIDQCVCYHDTQLRKPHPDPFLEALKRCRVGVDEAIAVGDDVKDTQAAHTAQIFSIGALWGSLQPAALIGSRPDILCKTVEDLRAELGKFVTGSPRRQ